MLKEGFEWLANVVKRAESSGRVIHPREEPEHVYYLVGEDGKLNVQFAHSKPRDHQLYTVGAFVEAVKSFKIDDPKVFAGNGQINAVLQDGLEGPGRPRLEMALIKTPQFLALKELAGDAEPLSQRAFVDLMRITLNGCISPDVINLFRSLKQSVAGETESSVSSSAQQVSRKVLTECRAGGKCIPDQIEVAITVYQNVDQPTRPVQCAVVSDLAEMTFALIPLPGQVDKALQEADELIVNGLRANLEGVAEVFAGRV